MLSINGALRNSSTNWIFFWRLHIQNHLKLSITEKRVSKAQCWTWNPEDLPMWRRLSCLILSKAFDISSPTAWVVPDILKALAIFSDTTVRRSAVDLEDLKPYLKSEKRPHFNKPIIYNFFKDFTNRRKMINRAVIFSCIPFPNIPKCKDHQ